MRSKRTVVLTGLSKQSTYIWARNLLHKIQNVCWKIPAPPHHLVSPPYSRDVFVPQRTKDVPFCRASTHRNPRRADDGICCHEVIQDTPEHKRNRESWFMKEQSTPKHTCRYTVKYINQERGTMCRYTPACEYIHVNYMFIYIYI